MCQTQMARVHERGCCVTDENAKAMGWATIGETSADNDDDEVQQRHAWTRMDTCDTQQRAREIIAMGSCVGDTDRT